MLEFNDELSPVERIADEATDCTEPSSTLTHRTCLLKCLCTQKTSRWRKKMNKEKGKEGIDISREWSINSLGLHCLVYLLCPLGGSQEATETNIKQEKEISKRTYLHWLIFFLVL